MSKPRTKSFKMVQDHSEQVFLEVQETVPNMKGVPHVFWKHIPSEEEAAKQLDPSKKNMKYIVETGDVLNPGAMMHCFNPHDPASIEQIVDMKLAAIRKAQEIVEPTVEPEK